MGRPGRVLYTPLTRPDYRVVVAPGVLPMTPAHRVEVVLTEDGKLLLEHLPFRAGQTVEVIVLLAARPTSPSHPLRGTVLRYDQPTAPAAKADWDVFR